MPGKVGTRRMRQSLSRWPPAGRKLTSALSSDRVEESHRHAAARLMAFTYFKRYRMELDLRRWVEQPLRPPSGYRLLAWSPALVRAHADVKFRCFQHELDANLFPCFGSRDGCHRLMREISQREGFVP